MKKCLIISGGEFSGFEKLAGTLHGAEEPEPSVAGGKIPEYSLIIAADKGALYAWRLKIMPDVVIGDFDSYEDGADVSGQLNHQSCASEPGGKTASAGSRDSESGGSRDSEPCGKAASADGYAPEIIRLPREKDYSDTFFAVKYALNRGYLYIDFICIMGGRFDHMLSNLQTAAFAAEQGARCRLLGQRDIIHVICGENAAEGHRTLERAGENDAEGHRTLERAGEITIRKHAGWSVSAFALSERCEGVEIHGSKYDKGAQTTSIEVESVEKGAAAGGLTLCSTLPQGLSNEFAEGSARITYSLKRGVLAVVESRL